jgi:hypothetical protein
VLGTLGAIDLVTARGAVSGQVSSWLSWTPVVWIGKLSYSLYLWHWPIYTLSRWTVGLDSWRTRLAALGATVLLSWFSYVWIENPIRRGSFLRAVRPAFVIAAGLCCVLLSWKAAQRVDKAENRLSLSVTQKNSRDWYPVQEPLNQSSGPNCRDGGFQTALFSDARVEIFNHGDCDVTDHAKNLFVTGNSHAVAYDTLLSRLARLEPLNIRLYYNGCAFLPLASPMARDSERCRSFDHNFLAEIESRLHPQDILFLPSLRLPRFGDQWATYLKPDYDPYTPEAAEGR